MALDSASKRFSMINFGNPIATPLFIPDGTIDDGDKYHMLNLYFGIAISAVVEIWSASATNASLWYAQNPTETTWDGDTTFWDLNGNVYNTLWDNIDNTWADSSTNSVTWTEV